MKQASRDSLRCSTWSNQLDSVAIREFSHLSA
jgi:hypothetical protein